MFSALLTTLSQEIAQLRGQITGCEAELRTVSSPAYTARDRDRALAEQSVRLNKKNDLNSIKVLFKFKFYNI